MRWFVAHSKCRSSASGGAPRAASGTRVMLRALVEGPWIWFACYGAMSAGGASNGSGGTSGGREKDSLLAAPAQSRTVCVMDCGTSALLLYLHNTQVFLRLSPRSSPQHHMTVGRVPRGRHDHLLFGTFAYRPLVSMGTCSSPRLNKTNFKH